MDGIGHISLSLATAMERALGVTANNVANANTPGFRAERMSFEAFLPPAERTAGTYVLDDGSWIDERAGSVSVTGNPLDLALVGGGSFAYGLEDGRTAYGRDGQITVGADGVLATRSGARLLDEGGGEIVVPADAGAVQVTRDGTVSVDGIGRIARIGLHDVPDLPAFERIGRGLFVPPPGRDANARPAVGTDVIQGSIEGSNVEPVHEMTRLIEIQRAYERASSIMQTHDDLARDAVRRIARQT